MADIGTVEGRIRLRDEFSSQLEVAATKLDAFGGKWQRVGGSLTSIGGSLSKYVSLPLAAAGGAAFKFSSDFETSLTKMRTLVGLSAEDVQGFRSDILDLSGETARAPKELADAMFFITSAGLRGQEALDALKSSAQAAAIGLGQTESVADAVTSAMNAYGPANLSAADATNTLALAVRAGKLEAESLAPVMGRLLPTASALGIAFEDVAGVMAVMSRTGLDAAEASTSLSAIMSAMLKPTPAVAEALAGVHLSMSDLRTVAAGPGGIVDVMRLLEERFAGNDEALAAVIPNVRAFRGVMNVLAQDASVVDDVMGQVSSGVDVLGAGMEQVSETAGFKWDQFMTKAQTTLIAFGDRLAPTLTKILDVGVRLLDWVASGIELFGKLPEPIQAVAIGLGAVAAAIGPLVLVAGGLITAVGSISTGLATLAGVVGGGGALMTGLGGVVAILTGPVGLVAAAGAAGLALGKLIDDATGIGDAIEEKTGIFEGFANWWYELDDNVEGANRQMEEARRLHLETGGAINAVGTEMGRVVPLVETYAEYEAQVAAEAANVARISAQETAPAIHYVYEEFLVAAPAAQDFAASLDTVNEQLLTGAPAAQNFMDSIGQLPDVLGSAGGGGGGGFFDSILGGLGIGGGGGGGGGFFDSITNFFSGAGGNAAGGFLDGLTNMFGSGGLGGGLMGTVKNLLATGLDFIPIVGPLLSKFAGPLLSGLKALGGKIWGGIKSLFGGPSAEELAGRDAAADFRTTVDSMLDDAQRAEAGGSQFQQAGIAIRDAFVAVGKTVEEAHAAHQALWAAEKEGPEAVAEVWNNMIGPTMETVQAALGETGLGFTELRNMAVNTSNIMGIEVAEAFEQIASGAITSLADAHAAMGKTVEAAKDVTAVAVAEAQQGYQAALDAIQVAQKALTEATTAEAKAQAYEMLQAANESANAWKQELDSIKDAASDAASEVSGRMAEAADNIQDSFGEIEIDIPIRINKEGDPGQRPGLNLDVDGFASGGIVTRATLLVAGEDGPEAIVPLDRFERMGRGDGGEFRNGDRVDLVLTDRGHRVIARVVAEQAKRL